VTAATAIRAPGHEATPRPPRSRRLVGLLLLLGLLVAACLGSIAIGTRSIGLGEVWRALFDSDLGRVGRDPGASLGERCGDFGSDVAHDEAAGVIDEMLGHRATDLAQPDESHDVAHDRMIWPPSTLKI